MARKAIKDWTAEEFLEFSPAEANTYYQERLAQGGNKANAKYWYDQWNLHYTQKQNEGNKKAQAKANDPVRGVGYGVAGTSLAGGVAWGATEAVNAYKEAEAARKALDAANALKNAGTATNAVTNTANAANVANTASTVGTVPSTPVVVGGSYLPEAGTATEGVGTISNFGVANSTTPAPVVVGGSYVPEAGSAGMEGASATAGATEGTGTATSGMGMFAPTAALLAAQLGDHYFDKQKQDVKNANAAANPMAHIRMTPQIAAKIESGEQLSDEEEWAVRGAAAYASYFVGPYAQVIPEVYMNVNKHWSSSKGKDQLQRDNLRGYLEKQGILPDDDVIKFGDNTEFSMYKDGGARLDNFGKDDPRYDNNQRRYMDVDFTNPESEKSIQDIDPLALALLPEDVRLKSDLTGYLVNAVQTGDLANKGTRTQELYNRFGGYDSIKAAIDDRFKTGIITEEQKNSALASVDRVMGYKPTYTFGMGA